MSTNHIIPLKSVPGGRRDLSRAHVAIFLAILPFPLAVFLTIKGIPTAAIATSLQTVVDGSEWLFPGLARAKDILSGSLSADDQPFDLLVVISVWCLILSLIVAYYGFARGSGLTLENLRRSQLHAKKATSAGAIRLRCILFWIIFLICWAYAFDTVFRTGIYFVDAHQTCSLSVGRGRQEQCLSYSLLPLHPALWKLGWRASLGNLVLLALTVMSWLGIAGAWSKPPEPAENS